MAASHSGGGLRAASNHPGAGRCHVKASQAFTPFLSKEGSSGGASFS
jgi:hypothetical protein